MRGVGRSGRARHPRLYSSFYSIAGKNFCHRPISAGRWNAGKKRTWHRGATREARENEKVESGGAGPTLTAQLRSLPRPLFCLLFLIGPRALFPPPAPLCLIIGTRGMRAFRDFLFGSVFFHFWTFYSEKGAGLLAREIRGQRI